MTRVLVLGGGRVGGFMAEDLSTEPALEVTVADASESLCERLAATGRLKAVRHDLRDPGVVRRLAAAHDLVVGALPGSLGFQSLKAVLEARRSCVDISFFPEDAQELDALARQQGVTAVVDCGVAPGLCGIIAGHEVARLERCASLRVLVGGLPVAREGPFEYKAPFSPADVLEEYTRPARLKRNGKIEIVPALSEVETVELPGVGTLEAFLTDGLRSLLGLDVPDMVEKTLRYPGHAARLRLLRDAGFLSREPLRLGAVEVRPLDLTSALLFPRWRLAPGEREFTVMRVEVEGAAAGGRQRRTYDLLEHTDEAAGVSSMARTTGLPATIVARLLLGGELRGPGLMTPERLGADATLCRRIFDGLAARGISLAVSTAAR